MREVKNFKIIIWKKLFLSIYYIYILYITYLYIIYIDKLMQWVNAHICNVLNIYNLIYNKLGLGTYCIENS